MSAAVRSNFIGSKSTILLKSINFKLLLSSHEILHKIPRFILRHAAIIILTQQRDFTVSNNTAPRGL